MTNSRQQGFTLLEVVIALLIFLLGILALVVLFPVGLRSARDVMYDTRASLATHEAVAMLKTLKVAETIYMEYNSHLPAWTAPPPVVPAPLYPDTYTPPVNSPYYPPWRFPLHDELFMAALDGDTVDNGYLGAEVYPVFDGQGDRGEYSWEAIIYPMGIDWDSTNTKPWLQPVPTSAVTTPPEGFQFHWLGLYRCQIVVYRNYNPARFIAGQLIATRGSNVLTLSTPPALPVISRPDGTAVPPADYPHVFRTGRYIQVEVGTHDSAGNAITVPGVWFRIVRYQHDATNPGNSVITIDRPFFSIGPTDQDPAISPLVYSGRNFRIAAGQRFIDERGALVPRVIRAFDTVITASGVWRP